MAKRIKESMKKTTVDKWKKKQWYKIFAPKEFEMKELGETVATKPEQVIGRTIHVSVKDLLNQLKMHYVKIKFSVVEVKGKRANAEVAGHHINENYLRKFIRRRGSKIELVITEKSKDNAEVKLKAVAVSGRKADAGKRADIRRAMEKELREFVKSTDSNELVTKILSEKPIKAIMDATKKIAPVKRVELLKSEIEIVRKAQEQ